MLKSKTVSSVLGIFFPWGIACFFSLSSLAHASIQVVIDPGHGGSDEGTIFDGDRFRVSEKDVTLMIAKEVKADLLAQGYRVTLTREEDQDVPLPTRTALANQLKAQLFISIHMNSSSHSAEDRQRAEGVETFILNTTSDASSKRIARIENSVLSHQLKDAQVPEVAKILKDLTLDANQLQSKRLACHVQKQLVQFTSTPRSLHRRDRGVKQALFHVLLGADMPSVLVEAGFLSHAYDRSLALSYEGRKRMGVAISQAVQSFFHSPPSPSPQNSTLDTCKIN